MCKKMFYSTDLKLFNVEKWRASNLVLPIKNKGDIQECKNYAVIKLMSHTMKMWKRVISKRLREEVTISDEEFGFMPGEVLWMQYSLSDS